MHEKELKTEEEEKAKAENDNNNNNMQQIPPNKRHYNCSNEILRFEL